MRSSRTWCVKTTELALALAVLIGSVGASDASFAQRAQVSRSEPQASEGHQGRERSPSSWPVFAPDGGRFSVELPAAPTVERDSTWTPVGSVEMTKYWERVGDALLAVEVHD